MHGKRETSMAPRVVCTLAHAAMLGVAFWLYFGGGDATLSRWFGFESTSSDQVARRVVLVSFGVVLFLRIALTNFVLLKRKFGWDELGGVLFALLVYQVGFALLALPATTAMGPLEIGAVVIFIIGSWLNTGSELQRKAFKEDPHNAGKLYTGGLFRYARHINYFGDMLWVTAWAIVTRNAWSAVVPVVLTAGFVFAFIPSLNKYLRSRYGQQFEEWAKSTKALIPFIY